MSLNKETDRTLLHLPLHLVDALLEHIQISIQIHTIYEWFQKTEVSDSFDKL